MSAAIAVDYLSAPQGLRNLGNTCYFNSTLQALCALREFPEFVRNQRRMRSNGQLYDLLHSMVCGLQTNISLLEGAIDSLGSPFDEINPVTNIRYQQDASECFQKMFELLGLTWMLPYQGKCRSHQNSLWEPFFVLPLHLSSKRNIDFNVLVQESGIVIDQAPRWLVIHLMRFKWKVHQLEKNNAHVVAPEGFTLPIQGNSDSHYSLCASVNHVGRSADSGHCTCVCRRGGGEMRSSWWKCNDHVVTEVPSHEFASGKECYLLFFEKVALPSDGKRFHEEEEAEFCLPVDEDSSVSSCQQNSAEFDSDASNGDVHVCARRKKLECLRSWEVKTKCRLTSIDTESDVDSMKRVDMSDLKDAPKSMKGAFVDEVEVGDDVLDCEIGKGESVKLGNRANYPWAESECLKLGNGANCPWEESEILHRKKILLDVDTVSEFLIGDICWNCHRKEPEGVERTCLASCCDLGLRKCRPTLFKTKRNFSNLSAELLERALKKGAIPKVCKLCCSYLSMPSQKTKQKDQWAAFVWKLLLNKQTWRKVWMLVPKNWRCWWVRSLCKVQNEKFVVLNQMTCIFTDVTLEEAADVAALQSLCWGKDILPREDSLVLACVKCPAGCSEWKHKANELPLDVVWEHLIEQEIDLCSSRKKRSITHWFRDDYDVCEFILLNPKWKCMPSVCFSRTSFMPTVLSCRDHSTRTKGHMFHPCRHPLPVIGTEKANQFASIVPVPRTLRKAQLSAHSASFQVAKMQGQYFGVDTMFLSSQAGCFDHQDELAWEQEVLAQKGRSDVRAHTRKLAHENKVSTEVIDNLEKSAERLFPDWETTLRTSKRGGSHMTVDDALRLQENVSHVTEKAIVWTNQRKKKISFKPSWPRHLVWVHNTESCHGAQMIHPPDYKQGNADFDTRTAWTLSGILVCVPAVWESVGLMEKDVRQPEGWLLSHLSRKCFPLMKVRGSESNPFRKKRKDIDIAKMLQKSISNGCSPGAVFDFFGSGPHNKVKHPNIHVTWNQFEEPPVGSIHTVIVVKRSKNAVGVDLPEECVGNEWELRFLSMSEPPLSKGKRSSWVGRMFARHGTSMHKGWWFLGTKWKLPKKLPLDFSVSSVQKVFSKKWNVAVHCKDRKFLKSKMVEQMLEVCGGQTMCVCGCCNAPLIATLKDKTVLCVHKDENECCCQRVAWMKCPTPDCSSALCKKHAESGLKGERRVVVWPVKDFSARPPSRKRKREKISLLNGPSNKKLRRMKFGLRSSNASKFLVAQNELESLKESAFVCSLPQGEDSYRSEMPSASGETVPATDAGLNSTLAEISKGECSECRMTNHALLNVHGTCLIRKNNKIQGTLAQKAFLQKHVSTFPGRSIPLIYPEGCLHTDVFPFGLEDGSVIGAMPFSLLNSQHVLRRCGMLSLHDTFKTRLKSPALLASSNPRCHFWMFDAMANFSLRGEDTRLVLRRGFAEYLGQGGVRIRGQKEAVFNTEYVESKSNVSKLAAAVGEKMPTCFYTHTLSMKTHFGMRKIWEWITGEEVAKLHCKETTEDKIQEWRKALVDSFGSCLLRLWMEMLDLWIVHITKSPEKPLGEVTDHFCRIELQDPSAIGNLPHVHCLFWTVHNMKLKTDRDAACDNIRGFIEDVIRPDEAEQLIDEGIMTGWEEIAEFKEMLLKILPHVHRRRCFVIVKKEGSGSEDVKLKCKVQNNWRDTDNNAEHTFEEIPVKHSKEAIAIMKRLGLAANSEDECEFVPLVDWLKCVKHYPPAQGDEGIISPVVGALISRNPNCDNCQMTCGHFMSRHLNKHMLKIDKCGQMSIEPPEKGTVNNKFKVNAETVLNTKITSNNIAQKNKVKNKKNGNVASALGINITDAYMHILECPSVRTSLKFVKMSTDSYDTRAARERNATPINGMAKQKLFNGPQGIALTPINTLPPCHVRNARILDKDNKTPWPSWTQFTATQVLKMFDDLHSPLGLDSVTQFGFRPPELFWVRHQRMHFRWFSLHSPPIPSKCKSKSKPSIEDLIQFCGDNMPKDWNDMKARTWITGDTKVVKLRPKAIEEVFSCLQSSPLEFFLGDEDSEKSANKRRTMSLFCQLQRAIAGDWNCPIPIDGEVLKRFVNVHDTKLPVVWVNPEKPCQPHRFLMHLLLRFGSFIDECDLFGTGSLRLSFIKAKLLQCETPQAIEKSTDDLTRKWMEDELRIMPVGTATFDAHCVQGHRIISRFFADGTIVAETPMVLCTSVREETTKKNSNYVEQRQKTLVKHIHECLTKEGITNIPSVNSLLNATVDCPLHWDITNLVQPCNQPDESYADQKLVLSNIKSRIDSNVRMWNSAPVNTCIVGGAGVGKTFCALVATLYARSVGAMINGTTLMSERAQELGVVHMNRDLAVPIADYKSISAGQLAEKIVSALHRQPEKMHLQRTTDFCFIDELGALPAELMAARDIALRHIRENNLPNGGMQDLLTYDHLQLSPINGTHPMLSPFLTCSYSFSRLLHSVRASQDKKWQEIQSITRMNLTELEKPETKRRFIKLFTENLSFVKSASDVPKDALFVYGKNEPTRMHIRQMQSELRNDPNVIISTSVDYERGPGQKFIKAEETAIKLLDKKLREKHEVFFSKMLGAESHSTRTHQWEHIQMAKLHFFHGNPKKRK